MNKDEFEALLKQENVELVEKSLMVFEGSMCPYYKLKVKYEGAFGFPAAAIEHWVTKEDKLTYSWSELSDRAEKAGKPPLGKPSEMPKLTVNP